MSSKVSSKIEAWSLIKHERYLDTAIRVMHSWDQEDGSLKVEGMCVNLAFVTTFNLGVPIVFFIKPENAGEWSICTDPKLEEEPFWGKMSKSYRFSSWQKLFA